jgi:hypothetical protein
MMGYRCLWHPTKSQPVPPLRRLWGFQLGGQRRAVWYKTTTSPWYEAGNGRQSVNTWRLRVAFTRIPFGLLLRGGYSAAIYRQQKVLSPFPVCCWIDWLLMIKNCLIESGPPCSSKLTYDSDVAQTDKNSHHPNANKWGGGTLNSGVFCQMGLYYA